MRWSHDSTENVIDRVLIQPGTDPNKQHRLPVKLIESFKVVTDETHMRRDDQVVVFSTQFLGGVSTKTASSLVPKDTARSPTSILAEVEHALSQNQILDDMPKETLGKLYDNEIEEFLDDKEELLRKIKYIANAIRQSKHCVVYTGAGVSTRFVVS
jgi:hypothetical protein